MIITAKQGRGDKVHVSVDGEYLLTVDREFWFSQGIASGGEIAPERLEQLKVQAEFRRAYNRALGILSYAPKSRRALLERLIRDGVSPDAAEQAADQLEEYGLLNDAEYAALYAEELLRNKKVSARGAVDKLVSRGIPRELARAAVADLPFDEESGIEDLLRGKLSYFSRSPRDRDRAVAALARRGYAYSDIRRVMERLCEEFDSGE